MKKNNPHTPIMMREAAGTLPKVYARYGSSTANNTILNRTSFLTQCFFLCRIRYRKVAVVGGHVG